MVPVRGHARAEPKAEHIELPPEYYDRRMPQPCKALIFHHPRRRTAPAM